MKKKSLMHQLFFLSLICAIVYLGFLYLLPLAFPFILAYLLMRMLWPVMQYLHKHWRWPRFLSNYGVLLGFFSSVTITIAFLFWQIMSQLRLFFSNFPVYQQLLTSTLCRQRQYICNCVDYYLHLDAGTADLFLDNQMERLEQKGFNLLSDHAGKTIINCLSSSFHFFAVLLIIIISMIILVKEMGPLNEKYRNSRYYTPVHTILLSLKKSGLSYLRTELIILLINAIVCSLGLFLIHNPYFFILGIAVAIFDAFPILGSGMIFLPWCLFEFFNHNYYFAAILITTYLITLFVREFLEAKMLGDGMGISPFFMLAAIFIGIELFGVTGIFLGPFGVVLIRAILTECKQI